MALRHLGLWLLLAVGVALALWLGASVWHAAGAGSIPPAGWVAIVLGVLATAGLGGGLMALVFYSSRSGIDDRVGDAAYTPPGEEPDDGPR